MKNKELLKVMIDNDDTKTALAEYLGVSRGQLSKLVSGKSEWKLSHIKKIAERYQLSNAQIMDIFIMP